MRKVFKHIWTHPTSVFDVLNKSQLWAWIYVAGQFSPHIWISWYNIERFWMTNKWVARTPAEGEKNKGILRLLPKSRMLSRNPRITKKSAWKHTSKTWFAYSLSPVRMVLPAPVRPFPYTTRSRLDNISVSTTIAPWSSTTEYLCRIVMIMINQKDVAIVFRLVALWAQIRAFNISRFWRLLRDFRSSMSSHQGVGVAISYVHETSGLARTQKLAIFLCAVS